MNISKISRSIVVVIFIAIIIFLSYLDISSLIHLKEEVTGSVTSTFIKIGFVFAVILLVSIYMYIKDKLYKMHVKKHISYVYRYIYIVLVILAISILNVKLNLSNFSDNMIIIYILFTLGISILIKKIIFNVSKSDILSVLGMFTYALLPKIVIDNTLYITSTIFTFIFLSLILVLQILIDELKQKGVKTKKYIIESIILGLLMGISCVMSISIWVWIILFGVMLFVTYNLDNTHISFPKKIMTSITQTQRESLYKIERININKLIVSIVISIFIMLVINSGINLLFNKMNNNYIISNMLNTISENKIQNISLNSHIFMNNFFSSAKNIVSLSKVFYLVLFIYILFMEALAFFLHRRYDTKSTIMKIIFILQFICVCLFNLNIYYFQPLFTILLMLIAIVNTSNIYLNREERIKLLVS